MTYSDDILLTYLSGSFDADAALKLEQAVEIDPALEARLMALDPFAAPIKEVFSNIHVQDRVANFLPEVEVAPSPAPSVVLPFMRYAAAALVGVVASYGLFATNGNNGPLLTDWRDQVAAYQVLYVPETVQSISSTPDEISGQFKTAQEQLGLDLQQAVLTQIPDLELKRAQILGFNDAPLIQIAFEGVQGTPVALCIIRNDQGRGTLMSETLAGLASASWSTDDHSFLLIGGTQQDQITQTASELVKLF